ncbi:MAG: hypothetical protein CVV64_03720 [Candidatus Wallbacteria bacterium HGW-Wallbacteria-1]|uniref:6-bladed beta-propeller n=1 Tax=Candidatus Wallbacteria bacterium HGW-Wallbacteria-1 TaxID=2013854 RepID=A0A2N1PU26_9BACT|nr:MAG: hypothetical protein CVV64_03720 [Candidatus Wallbacteria bacterium HGW-Wallbacteria-1]
MIMVLVLFISGFPIQASEVRNELRATAFAGAGNDIIHIAMSFEWTGDVEVGGWLGNGYYRIHRGYHSGGDLFVRLTPEASVDLASSLPEYLTLEVRVRSVTLSPMGDFGGTGSTDGRFISPSGISADYQGNIFVVDTGNDRVQKFSPDGIYLDQFGEFSWEDPTETAIDTGENENGAFNEPSDVVATVKEIMVLDAENHRVSRFDRHLVFIRSFGSFGDGDCQFEKPSAIGVDEARNIFVLDRENDCIQKLDIDGNFMMRIGRFGWSSGLLNGPMDMECTGKGEIFVADTGNERVVRFDELGNFVLQFPPPSKPFIPRAIALDSYETVHVADSAGARIVSYDRDGHICGVHSGAAKGPRGLAAARMMDGKVRIFVSDGLSNRVQYFGVSNFEWAGAVRVPVGRQEDK